MCDLCELQDDRLELDADYEDIPLETDDEFDDDEFDDFLDEFDDLDDEEEEDFDAEDY